MKNWMLILGISATMIFAASCNKDENGDYVCVCSDSSGNNETRTSFVDRSLVEAQKGCSTREDQLNDNIFNVTYTCHID
ncbi:hypothetical protein BH09BAC1_BH09BAC1_00180 [soil metagenome]